MEKTAMQDLRQDLLDTIITGSNALNEIEDEQIKLAAKNLFETTINTIISRIDEELLEMEKQQQGYSEEDMKLAFETGKNFQLIVENNFIEWIKKFKNK
jgi:hypothetical protein